MPTFALAPEQTETEKVILAEKHFTVTHNVAENWLYCKWKGERTAEKLIKGAEQLLECVKTTGCRKLINDSSELAQSVPDLVDWIAVNFAPRLQEAGIQYFAWIYNDQNKIKNFADSVLSKEKSDILVMVFDNLKTAEIWLGSVQK